LQLFSFGDYGLALAALALMVFGANECPPKPNMTNTDDVSEINEVSEVPKDDYDLDGHEKTVTVRFPEKYERAKTASETDLRK